MLISIWIVPLDVCEWVSACMLWKICTLLCKNYADRLPELFFMFLIQGSAFKSNEYITSKFPVSSSVLPDGVCDELHWFGEQSQLN